MVQSEAFTVGHVVFRLSSMDEGLTSFSLLTEDQQSAERPKALFTGLVGPDMANELRNLADYLDGLDA